MKITQTQIKQIVMEEVTRYKKIYELEQKQSEIKKQLNEMYGGTELEEGLFGFGQNKEKEAAQANFEANVDKLIASGAIGDKNKLMAAAAGNNYKGIFQARKSAKDGRNYIVYVPQLSGLEKLGSAASSFTGGGGSGAAPKE